MASVSQEGQAGHTGCWKARVHLLNTSQLKSGILMPASAWLTHSLLVTELGLPWWPNVWVIAQRSQGTLEVGPFIAQTVVGYSPAKVFGAGIAGMQGTSLPVRYTQDVMVALGPEWWLSGARRRPGWPGSILCAAETGSESGWDAQGPCGGSRRQRAPRPSSCTHPAWPRSQSLAAHEGRLEGTWTKMPSLCCPSTVRQPR